jgi:hypothetical protein
VLAQLVRGHLCGDDDRAHLLAEVGVVEAGHRGLGDRGMSLQALFDLEWVHVLAAAQDQVAASGGQLQQTVA